ncbi:MAG: chaperone NapD [Rubrivivax sp.]|nr:chaperone NapD [Rubrivivax sp.]
MSILGAIVRCHPKDSADLAERLRREPGVDLARRADGAEADGRFVVAIEDSPGSTAAETLAAIALWPQVLNTSLVYEHAEGGGS